MLWVARMVSEGRQRSWTRPELEHPLTVDLHQFSEWAKAQRQRVGKRDPPGIDGSSSRAGGSCSSQPTVRVPTLLSRRWLRARFVTPQVLKMPKRQLLTELRDVVLDIDHEAALLAAIERTAQTPSQHLLI